MPFQNLGEPITFYARDVPGASAATRERVRKVAAGLGYRPDVRARLLRQQRSRLLSVTFEVEQAFHGDLVEGIYAAAEPAGYDVVLSPIAPGRAESRAIEDILGDRCEAAILLGPRSSTRSLAALAAKLPVVVVARSIRSSAVNQFYRVQQAMRHESFYAKNLLDSNWVRDTCRALFRPSRRALF